MHRGADDPLDFGQKARGGRLRHPDPICRLGDLPGFHQRGQKPQMAELEPTLRKVIGGREHNKTAM
ncbi:hypothetical protein MASR2M74_11000 [Paracoccaceae bacterium]